MKVVVIHELNHGFLAVALNYYNAVKWLIDEGWLNAYDNVYIDGEWKEVKDVFGEDWKDLMLNEWDLNRFNEVFDELFQLQSVAVKGGEYLFNYGSE